MLKDTTSEEVGESTKAKNSSKDTSEEDTNKKNSTK